MQRLKFSSLFLILLLGSLAATAQDSVPPSSPSSPPASSDQNTNFEAGQNLEVEPTKTTEAETKFTIQSGKSSYSFDLVPRDPEVLKIFASMTESDITSFQMKRKNLLAKAATTLNSVKYSFGIGALTKDGLIFLKQKAFPSAEEKAQEESRSRGLKARSTQVTQSILTAIDSQLLAQGPLVANSNEYGMTLNVGFAALGGTNQRPFGGLFDLGFSLTYNEATKTLVFQLYRNKERFVNTSTGMTSYIGLAFKAGILLYNRYPGTELSSLRGSTFYPPAMPGYLTRSTNMISSGFSSGLGFPPPPFGDLLTYTNQIDHRTLVRISVSPLVKGFIRLGFGVHRQDFIWIPETIDRMHDIILRSWRKAGLCKMVYVH